MGILSRLFKKEEKFDEKKLGMGMGGMPEMPEFGAEQRAPTMPPSFQQPEQEFPQYRPLAQQMPISARPQDQFEVLSAKLETIRVLLDNINQRLKALERIAEESEAPRYR